MTPTAELLSTVQANGVLREYIYITILKSFVMLLNINERRKHINEDNETINGNVL